MAPGSGERLVATHYLYASDHDRAMDWLERAYEAHTPTVLGVASDPGYYPLRSDPRFQDLLRRMNLSDDQRQVRP